MSKDTNKPQKYASLQGNKFALGHGYGRPRKYDCPKKLDDRVTEFIMVHVESNQHPTLAGFALFLGFSSKSSVYEYAGQTVFKDSIKRGLLFIEQMYEQKLLSQNVTGAIFALKNMGWKDKTETDITSGGNPINIPPSEWID